MTPSPSACCLGRSARYATVWHAATAWRCYWPELLAHVRTLGLDRITEGAVS